MSEQIEQLILDMKVYAKDNHVPIMTDEGLDFVMDTIKKYQCKNVLEIGTAIGYSAISFVQNTGCFVDTIERNPEMISLAKNNISQAGLLEKIRIIEGDALLIDIHDFSQYDLILIDAAKAQYINFFNRYEPFLKKGGVILTDNLSFHNLVAHPDQIVSRNVKQLVRKINHFITWLKENNRFDTTFYEIGDGMSKSIKK